MKRISITIVSLILMIGLLSACGSQPAETSAPASQPTETSAPVTEAPAATAAPTDAAQPTQEPTVEPAPATGVSFANDVLPILSSRCLNCHGGDRVEEGFSVKTYEELMAGSENGAVIIPGDANGSLFVELIVNQKMPKRGPKLTPPQVQIIVDWVNQGALNN